jgi:hypothetical protein
VEDPTVPGLTSQHAEESRAIVETAPRNSPSKAQKNITERSNVPATLMDTKTVNLRISVDADFLTTTRNTHVQELISEAVKQGFKSAERQLSVPKCRSQK